MDTISEPLKVGTRIHQDRYEIRRLIAKDKFGFLYEASVDGTDQKVLLKEYFPDSLYFRENDGVSVYVPDVEKRDILKHIKKTFIEEFQNASGSNGSNSSDIPNDPRFLRAKDAFHENGTIYFVMDFIEGGKALNEIIAQRGALPERESLNYIKQLSKILESIHSTGNVHLSVNPNNIIIDSQGKVYLLESYERKFTFVIDKENKREFILGLSDEFTPFEQPGTPARGLRPASDIYSLGATLYTCLTGYLPFEADIYLYASHLEDLPSHIDIITQVAIRQAMRPNSLSRTQSIQEFLSSLVNFPSGLDQEHLIRYTEIRHFPRISENEDDRAVNHNGNSNGIDIPKNPNNPPISFSCASLVRTKRESFVPEMKQEYKERSKQNDSIFKRITKIFFAKRDDKKDVGQHIVNSCVYAPAEVKRDDYMLVQVFLYKDNESEKVQMKAKIVDKEADLRQYKPLEMPIKKGDKVGILLKVKGCEIEEDRKEFVWQGVFNSRELSVFVPSNAPRTLLGTVVIFINDLPAGEMVFKTSVIYNDKKPSKVLSEFKSQKFEKIFVSYSHNDQDRVRHIVEGLRIANADYFYDRHTLKPGDNFREVIKNWIEDSDVFVLCWSQNAAGSVEVKKEVTMALDVSRREHHLRIYPLSINPEASLPPYMSDIYNFGTLHP